MRDPLGYRALSRPPGNILLSLFPGLSSNELGICVSSPEIGGLSLNDSRSLSRLVLKESRLSASVRSLGNMFRSRGPFTANEF